MPGIAGLAAALGGEHHPPAEARAPKAEAERCESRKRKSGDHDKSVNHDALLKELGARSAPGPHLSALELSSGSVDKEFKKKKKHKKSRVRLLLRVVFSRSRPSQGSRPHSSDASAQAGSTGIAHFAEMSRATPEVPGRGNGFGEGITSTIFHQSRADTSI